MIHSAPTMTRTRPRLAMLRIPVGLGNACPAGQAWSDSLRRCYYLGGPDDPSTPRPAAPPTPTYAPAPAPTGSYTPSGGSAYSTQAINERAAAAYQQAADQRNRTYLQYNYEIGLSNWRLNGSIGPPPAAPTYQTTDYQTILSHLNDPVSNPMPLHAPSAVSYSGPTAQAAAAAQQTRAATVTLTNSSRPGQDFRVGDNFRIEIRDAARDADVFISATQNGSSLGRTKFGKTNAYGFFEINGALEASHQGTWSETFEVGGRNISTISFRVDGPPSGTAPPATNSNPDTREVITLPHQLTEPASKLLPDSLTSMLPSWLVSAPLYYFLIAFAAAYFFMRRRR